MHSISNKIWNPVFAQDKTWTFHHNEFLHPCHSSESSMWDKYRLVQCGGQDFINRYLQKFSVRENDIDFRNRKLLTYNPAHAKNAVTDVKNAIHQRMVDVTRKGGPESYQRSITGLKGGVDLIGSTMNRYMGNIILPELLFMRRVGIYIDKPRVDADASLADTKGVRPYVYMYRIEDILSWSINREGQLVSLLLRDTDFTVNERFGLTTGTQESFRFLQLREEGGVLLELWKDGKTEPHETIVLNLKHIPFTMLEISHSLLNDTADYQISLLNLASSDMNYAFKANYPFYTEQYDARVDFGHHLQGGDKDGTAEQAALSGDKEIKTGSASQGRMYPKGMDRPGFIHPSPEPLMASMAKQAQLKTEIRELTDLALSQITSSSAESKAMDERGMEAGLSAIGLELELAENFVAESWSEYEGSTEIAQIKYPKSYSLQSDEERRKEAKEIDELKDAVPSATYKKELSKQVAKIILGNKMTEDQIEQINSEVDSSIVVETSSETIINDHEAGLVSTETASKIRGYPEGEVDKAKEDHAERAARIALAQSSAGARGVADLSADSGEANAEKLNSQSADINPDGGSKTRGDE